MSSEKKYFLGIDPGINGAMALVSIASIGDFIVEDYKDKENVKRFLRKYSKKIILAGVEEVLAMPRTVTQGGKKKIIQPGVKSMLTCGKGAGYYDGALDMLDIPCVIYRPSSWQKDLLRAKRVGEHKKQRSMEAAIQLFPKAELYGKLGGKKDGRADALLIAYHTRKKYLERCKG